ncbi:MAG: type 2 isopentenyl-diphosphate Delta-isomerase [Pseudomonadota bacterium]
MTDIEQRKNDHLDIVLRDEVTAIQRDSGLQDIHFVHCALPELDLSQIDLKTNFLGKRVNAPILISSMTGGPARAATLNKNIAVACNALGLAFGVGSQRIALQGASTAGFGKDLRQAAPNAVILANFGAAQLQDWDGIAMARRAVDMIEADGLIIHLNPLQEAVQPNGDTNWSDLLGKIEKICKACDFPVICKEVGAGLSGAIARRLVDAGVTVIDVAGRGGTSWVTIEAERAEDSVQKRIAEPFHGWGIPTARAIVEVRQSCPDTTIISSGGIRDGLDCAKSIRLGADLVGLAAGVLTAAIDDERTLIEQLEVIIEQLRIACFCTGSGDLAQLRHAPLLDQPSYMQ